MNNSGYESFDYISTLWKLADTLTVVQAAAFIAGFDPILIRYNAFGGVYFESETGLTDSNGSHGVQTGNGLLFWDSYLIPAYGDCCFGFAQPTGVLCLVHPFIQLSQSRVAFAAAGAAG